MTTQKRRIGILGVLAAAAMIPACHQEATTQTAAQQDGRKLQRQELHTRGLDLQEIDINQDGQVDQRVYAKSGVIQVAERDFNFDGKVDMVEFYENGVHSRDEIDLDYDGIVDLVVVYENGRIVRKEYAIDFEGNRHGVQLFDAQGCRYEIQRDTDGDGTMDTIETYAEGDAQPQRIQKVSKPTSTP